MTEFARSPLLMNRANSALVVIDVQDRLLPHIPNAKQLVWNVGRLIDGAQTLGVPVFATEQYPKGLGPTTESLRRRLGSGLPEKTMFSCRECGELIREFQEASVYHLLLVGIETHVCVAQSALDFMSAGFNVLIGVDAIGSRFDLDREIALRRLESSGATLTTTEAALFEWCERAGTAEFKTISQLVQQQGPDGNAIGF